MLDRNSCEFRYDGAVMSQCSRQDSNLRSSPCKGAAVAAGPREHQSRRDESNVPEPAYQTGAWPLGYVWMSGQLQRSAFSHVLTAEAECSSALYGD
jgi:hypothetical protein